MSQNCHVLILSIQYYHLVTIVPSLHMVIDVGGVLHRVYARHSTAGVSRGVALNACDGSTEATF